MIRNARLSRYVYFARRVDETGPVKIGNTSSLRNRTRELNIVADCELEMLAWAPGGFTAERAVHLKFADSRIRGEWFEPTEALFQFIAAVRAHGELPLRPDERREQVFAERYLAGETYQQIANDHGLSRERVRQILRSHGVPALPLKVRRAGRPTVNPRTYPSADERGDPCPFVVASRLFAVRA